MTTQEFSNMFDTLLNSYNNLAIFGEASSKADIVLDEYEKSVLLTQALDIIVKSFFDRNSNSQGQGFDDSTRRLVDFSSLITVSDAKKHQDGTSYDYRGVLFDLPEDILVILNEKIRIDNKYYVVVPINYKEYDRQMSKAYTQPLKKLAWRLFDGLNSSEPNGIVSEIIPVTNISPQSGNLQKENILLYSIRYVKRPKPIVLVDLSADNLDIDGEKVVTQCELNPILHMEILNKALEIAISTRGGRVPSNLQNERTQLQQ